MIGICYALVADYITHYIKRTYTNYQNLPTKLFKQQKAQD